MLNFLLNVNKEDLNIGTECTTVSFPLGISSLTASFLGFILFQPSNCAGFWYLTYLTYSTQLGFIIWQGNFTPECSLLLECKQLINIWPSNRVGAFIINHPNHPDKWDIFASEAYHVLSCSISASQNKIIQTHPIMKFQWFPWQFSTGFHLAFSTGKPPQNISKSLAFSTDGSILGIPDSCASSATWLPCFQAWRDWSRWVIVRWARTEGFLKISYHSKISRTSLKCLPLHFVRCSNLYH